MTEVVVAVPGKVMLAGEYSVLDGGRALAVTVDRRLIVRASDAPELGRVVMVESNLWNEARRLESGDDPADFQDEPLLEATARAMELHGLAGARVKVSSELDVSFGIGSSSALRLAVLVAVEDLARQRQGAASRRSDELWEAAREALRLQRGAQSQASGYDIATQLVGGLALFRGSADLEQWPLECRPAAKDLAALGDLVHIFVGGRGAPTGSVTADTMSWLKERGLLHRVAAATDDLIEDFHRALAAQDDDRQVRVLARAVGVHRKIFSASPHFPKPLAVELEALPDCDRTWSFKTTGAGGEDALLLIGATDSVRPAATLLEGFGWRPLPKPFHGQGLSVERRGATRV